MFALIFFHPFLIAAIIIKKNIWMSRKEKWLVFLTPVLAEYLFVCLDSNAIDQAEHTNEIFGAFDEYFTATLVADPALIAVTIIIYFLRSKPFITVPLSIVITVGIAVVFYIAQPNYNSCTIVMGPNGAVQEKCENKNQDAKCSSVVIDSNTGNGDDPWSINRKCTSHRPTTPDFSSVHPECFILAPNGTKEKCPNQK